MKLLRYGLAGQEKPAAIDANGKIRGEQNLNVVDGK